MSSRTLTRRTAFALLAPLATAGIVATAAPAHAIPFEGEPTSSTCLRIAPLVGAGPAGSPTFVSHGYVLVLTTDCGRTPH